LLLLEKTCKKEKCTLTTSDRERLTKVARSHQPFGGYKVNPITYLIYTR
jgi:hypothetical protein